MIEKKVQKKKKKILTNKLFKKQKNYNLINK